MSVLVLAENNNGGFKKAAFEVVSYAAAVAASMGTSLNALVLGSMDDSVAAELGKYGAAKVIKINEASLDTFEAHAHAKAVAEVAKAEGSKVVVLANTYAGKSIAPRLSVKLSAALAAAAVDLPDLNVGFSVRRTVFSNKGFAHTNLTTEIKIVSLTPNSFKLVEQAGTAVVENRSVGIAASDFKAEVQEVKTVTGKIPLTEAELVVSAGRGMKGADHWHLIESLAEKLGAATACSKPVSDMHWRPHDEHVGQTGITIKPNLYIAIGISGAIQHLAGVSGSKVIVAINTDKEAPFFKIADYGIVGDAFEVVPKLTEAIEKFKAAN
ncbi:MAG: electron transfer flavoprotein subunit alpha/FixB family protein [Bacteroidia bacterium]